MSQTALKPPKLAKPGAGLPFIEGFMARFWVMPTMPWKKTWDEIEVWFDKESKKIAELVLALSEEQMTQKVLIPRLTGLEDSSRFWSAAETLEHLVIVSQGMSHIVVSLSSEQDPGIEVDIAKVKPPGSFSGKQAADLFLKAMSEQKMLYAEKLKDKQARRTHFHPWFGQISIHQWHWLRSSHHLIHRKQLEQIILRLNKHE